MASGLSIIIPCWNSRALIEENLPSVLAAAGRLMVPWEIIVVDDGSTDGLADLVTMRFPEARLLRHQANQGFAAACRTGVDATRYSLIYFLNSDVEVEPGAFQAILPRFADDRLFAVASLDEERKPLTVPAITNRWGLLGVRYVPVPVPTESVPVLFATGGHSAYDAEKFRELGGFDRLFAPIYFEDIDLCVRARARGWQIVLEPRSRVHHRPGSSVSRRYSARWLRRWRAGQRWLFTLRHSPSLTCLTGLALLAVYRFDAIAAWLHGARRAGFVRRAQLGNPAAVPSFSAAAVKRAHGIAWTIAYASPTGDIRGGGELSLLTLLAALDRTRIRPRLLCPSNGELARRARALGVEVTVWRFPPTPGGIVDGSLLKLIQWMREMDIDLVHANAAGRCLLLPGLAARALGIPVIWHARIADKQPVADWVGSRVASAIIATSHYVAQKFRGVRRHIELIPNAVDLSQFRPDRDGQAWRARYGVRPDQVLIGTVGRLDAWKCFEVALEAFVHARRAAQNLRLAFIGDGPERSHLVELARRRQVADEVIFTGWQQDAAEAMAALDLLLHPTPGEHFGRTIVEAMAAGKPVVARHSGAMPELVIAEQTGLLVREQTPEALAESVKRLASDRTLRDRMGGAARRRAEQSFSPALVAGRVAGVYEVLLRGSSRER